MTDLLQTIDSLINDGKISGVVTLETVEAAVTDHLPSVSLDVGTIREIRNHLDKRYQVVASDNDALTTAWRIKRQA